MITIFNRKELVITYDMKKMSEIKEALSQENIEYYTQTINRRSPSPFAGGMRSRTGSFGENLALEYEYRIFVRKDDFEKAYRRINGIN